MPETSTATTRPWDGFLPGLHCERCQKPLQGLGSGRPAESYAGTFNGLCYDCTGAAPFIAREFEDGSVMWSHPPHCPSWRRDRELFLQFPGCRCNKGIAKRGYSYGASYPISCERCWALRSWRDRLAEYRKHQWIRAETYITQLDAQAERIRKAGKQKAAEASDTQLKSRQAQLRRQLLQDVWNLPPEAWTIPAEVTG